MPKIAESIRVIDGAGVPERIYQAVKAKARDTGETQFIGFCYFRPEALRVQWTMDWEPFESRNASAREQERNGENCAYILGLGRDELGKRFMSYLSMILWITPEGDTLTKTGESHE